MVFKYLFLTVLASSLSAAGEAEGWFPVEKTEKIRDEVEEEEDASIWILFAKDLGSERFSLRFPKDPVYRYAEAENLEISLQQGEESFQLIVLPATAEPSSANSSFVSPEGKWVREHFVRTAHHLYLFRTVGSDNDAAHQIFISSFSIEKNG